MALNLLKSILPRTVFAVLNFATPQAQAQRRELYVLDVGRDQVSRYDAKTGELLGAFISSNGELDAPDGFIFGPDGNAYVGGFYSDNIVKYDGRTGEYISTFASGVDGATQMVFDRDGNLIVVSYGDEQTGCSMVNSCSILRYDGNTGEFLGVFASGGILSVPDGLALGLDSNLYVSDFVNDQILRYDLNTGKFLGVFASGGGLDSPSGFIFGPDGNLYVTSYFGSQVLRYNGNTGEFLGVFASGGSLNLPDRLAFGPDSNLYVSSFGSNEVLRYDGRTGEFIGTFISDVNGPADLVFVTVPESSSVLGILAFGACGGVSLLRRKQRKKNLVQGSSRLSTQITG